LTQARFLFKLIDLEVITQDI